MTCNQCGQPLTYIMRDVGTHEITVKAIMSREEACEFLEQTGRIFRLEVESYDCSKRDMTFCLVPDNGVMRIEL